MGVLGEQIVFSLIKIMPTCVWDSIFEDQAYRISCRMQSRWLFVQLAS